MKHYNLQFACDTDNPCPTIFESIAQKTASVVYNLCKPVDGSTTASITFNEVTAIRHRSIHDNKSDFIKYGLIRDALYEREGLFILLFRNEAIEINASSFSEKLTTWKSTSEIIAAL